MNNRIEIPWNPIKFSTSPTTGFQWPPQALFQLLHRQRQQLLLEARLRVLAAQVALRRPKRRDLYGDILEISWGYTYMLIYVLYMYYILYYIYILYTHVYIYIHIVYTHVWLSNGFRGTLHSQVAWIQDGHTTNPTWEMVNYLTNPCSSCQ